MAARLLALVAAVAMVLGSLALRDRMDRGSGVLRRGSDDPVRVVCATELAPVCAAALGEPAGRYTATVEAAPATARRLMEAPAGADPGFDVWLAPGPWAAMVNEDRERRRQSPAFELPDRPVARSALIAVLRKDRADALRAGPCGAAIGWRCLGDAAGAKDRPLRLGAADRTEAEGALVRAAAVAGFLGRSDFDTLDVTDNAEATAWLAGLEQSITAARAGGATDLQRFLVARGTADGFLLTQAAAIVALAGAANQDQFEQVFLGPPATADVVVAVRRGGDGLGRQSDRVREVLRRNGWVVPGGAPVVGMDPRAGPLPEDDGLPSPGVLQALQDLR